MFFEKKKKRENWKKVAMCDQDDCKFQRIWEFESISGRLTAKRIIEGSGDIRIPVCTFCVHFHGSDLFVHKNSIEEGE